MAAPAGNNYWELRKNAGKGKRFSTPENLWEEACNYFEWCDDNPWYKNEQLKKPIVTKDEFGNEEYETIAQIPTARPYTISGLCLYLDIDEQTFANYGKKEGYEEYFGVVSRIHTVIYNQKYEGAAVGAFNPNIIARDLGLVDKKEHGGEMKLKVGKDLADETYD